MSNTYMSHWAPILPVYLCPFRTLARVTWAGYVANMYQEQEAEGIDDRESLTCWRRGLVEANGTRRCVLLMRSR